MSKPTFLLIHGAWHQPAHFAPLITAPKSCGYRVRAPALPSVAEAPIPSIQLDIDIVRTVIAEEIAHGNDVILVPHSYGGIVSTAAAKGFEKEARSRQQPGKQEPGKGRKNSVGAIATMTAFVLPEGKSIPVPEGRLAEGSVREQATINPLPPTLFYNDLPR